MMKANANWGPTDPGEKYLELLRHALTGAIYQESSWREVKPKNAIKRRIVDFLARYNLKLFRVFEYDHAKRETGADWPGIAHTMVGLRRLENIEKLIKIIVQDDIPGDILEAGVWRGGASIYAQGVLRTLGEKRKIWLADSFQGLPEPSLQQDKGYDVSDVEYLKVGADYVRQNFERCLLWDDNIAFLEGWFSDTLASAPIDQLALLRLDGDLYESTMDALVPLYDKLSVGGFVIVDDYYTWPPCRQAISDFVEQRNIPFQPVDIDHTAIYWRKQKTP